VGRGAFAANKKPIGCSVSSPSFLIWSTSSAAQEPKTSKFQRKFAVQTLPRPPREGGGPRKLVSEVGRCGGFGGRQTPNPGAGAAGAAKGIATLRASGRIAFKHPRRVRHRCAAPCGGGPVLACGAPEPGKLVRGLIKILHAEVVGWVRGLLLLTKKPLVVRSRALHF